jgi:tetratricopeptide (TPR) repeat protein
MAILTVAAQAGKAHSSMPTPSEMNSLGEQGKRDFESGRYDSAADRFRQSALLYAEAGDRLNAAEQRNNLSVTLLKLRRPQDALDEVAGTDEIFAAAGDKRRQGMALNNRAAALQDLHRDDEALAAYEQAAQWLGEAGEAGLRGEVLKAAAALQLRRGKVAESGMRMLDALGSSLKPNWLERALKSLLRLWR